MQLDEADHESDMYAAHKMYTTYMYYFTFLVVKTKVLQQQKLDLISSYAKNHARA